MIVSNFGFFEQIMLNIAVLYES